MGRSSLPDLNARLNTFMDSTGVLEDGLTVLKGFNQAVGCQIEAPQVWVPAILGICAHPVTLTSVGRQAGGQQA